MNLSHKKETMILAGLLALWLLGSQYILRGEATGLRIMPELWRMNKDERGAVAGGPIYTLSVKAASVVPPDGVEYFITPEEGSNFYAGRFKYYNYPRKVYLVAAESALGFDAFRKGGYIVFHVPSDPIASGGIEPALTGKLRCTLLYEYTDEKVRQAVYRVEG